MCSAKILYLGKRALESGVCLSTNNYSFPWRLTLKYLAFWRLSVKPFDSWRSIPFWAPIIQPISSHPALNKYCLKYTFLLKKKKTLLNSRKRKEMPGGVSVIAHVRYIKILTWLRGFLTGHFSIFGLVLLVLNSLSGIARQWSGEKCAILFLKPPSHVWILIYRMWAIIFKSL